MEETTRGASIRLNDRWEIRAYDSMNWQTLEFKPQSGKWKPTGNLQQAEFEASQKTLFDFLKADV